MTTEFDLLAEENERLQQQVVDLQTILRHLMQAYQRTSDHAARRAKEITRLRRELATATAKKT